MASLKILLLALAGAAVVGTLVMLNHNKSPMVPEPSPSAALSGAGGEPGTATGAEPGVGAGADQGVALKNDTHAGTGAAAVAKDPNKDDLDWIMQEPNPEVTVGTTIKSVQRYHNALKALNEGQASRSIEIVFHMGQRAARDVIFSAGKMENAEYASVEPLMEGFVLDRRGVFEVYPNYEYFEKLATNKGSAGDLDYFITSSELNSNGIAKYLSQVTEVSTCTKYGDGLIVDAYQKWSDFKARYPQAYSAEVDKKIADATSELTTNDCLCGDKIGLIREFEKFFKAFPKTALTAELQARLNGIKKGTIQVQINCKAPTATETE